jgi:hypothetical protein
MEAAAAELSKPPFHRYANHGGHSVVAAYAVVPDGVLIQFRDGHVVLYNHDCPGRRHVGRMVALARDGRGLGNYITRHIGNRFAARIDDTASARDPSRARQSSTRQNTALR